MYSKYGSDINEFMNFLATYCTGIELGDEELIVLTYRLIKPFKKAKFNNRFLKLVLFVSEEYINFMVVEPFLDEIIFQTKVFQNRTTIDLSTRESPLSRYYFIPELDIYVNVDDMGIVHTFSLNEFERTISNSHVNLFEDDDIPLDEYMDSNCINVELDDEKYRKLRDEFLDGVEDCAALNVAITRKSIQLLAISYTGEIIKATDIYFNSTSFDYRPNSYNVCYICFNVDDLENSIT